MTKRLRAWLEETHAAGFELVRHFLGRLFESEMYSVPGEWQKVAGGVLAVLLSLGFLGFTTYMKRYGLMEEAHLSQASILQEMRAEELTFIAIAMGITALLTILVWQSMFPTLRDWLALAGLPLSARQIFLAKWGALLLAFTVFVLALNLPWAILFGGVSLGKLHPGPGLPLGMFANFAAMAGASAFVFFSLLACQGVLLNVLPARLFARVSLFVQATVFIAALGALPLYDRQPVDAAWWPAVWFIDLWQAIYRGSWSGSRNGILALAIPIALATFTYLVSYHRYRRQLLEALPGRAAARGAAIASWLLDRAIPDPRQQGAFAFIWKTLARSRSHRLILLAYAGIAVGAITKGALDMPRPSLRDEGMYGLIVTLAPLAFAMLMTVGLRYLFALPESLSANWVFQISDREGRAAWLTAAARFVVCCGIAPVFLIALPAAIAILGWLRASALTILGFFAALVFFEAMFRRWRKLPFTCSYLPGTRPVVLTLMRYAVATALLAPLGQLILHCSADPTALLALFTFEAAIWWKLRAARRAMWSACALSYEELPEAAVMTLDLQPPAGEQSATIPAAPPTTQSEDELFSALTPSRRMLPRDWADEIASERRRPALLLETFREDLRYAARMIRRNPLLSAVVVLTLTIGIGINASVFTIVNGLALRPHVYKDPDSFLRVIPTDRRSGRPREVSYPEYVALRDGTRSLRQLAAFTYFPAVVGNDDAVESVGLAVSCNFFSVDGLDRPLLGRLFVPEDCQAVRQIPPVVISASLWRNRFASDPRAVGRTAEINNRTVVIIGVVPDNTSAWVRTIKLWLPYTALTYFDPERNPFGRDESLWLDLAGRLAPGYSRSRAQAELNVLAVQQDRYHPGRRTAVVTTDGSWAATLEIYASTRDLMLIGFFLATFNLVLFISCANVATLMLSRAAARRREIAVRLSLGAPRIRLMRMLVTESLLLAAIAGAVSVWLAQRVPVPLYHLVASRAPDFPMPTDWRTFLYIAAIVLVTGVLAGVAPTLESLRVNLTASLKGHGGSLLGAAAGARVRNLLVTAQVALSMVLLVEAGLFARSEHRALRADPGYMPQKVVIVPLWFPEKSPLETTRARVQAIAHRMQALPGVHSVAFSDDLPLVRPNTVELLPPSRRDASQPVDVYTASPGFFDTLGIPLVRGREFKESDTSAVIVSQSLTRAFWRRQDPIGKTLPLPEHAATVVGIARDIEPMRIGGSENPPVYRVRHVHANRNWMSIRFDSGAAAGPAAVRAAIREVDPNLLVFPWLWQQWIDRITSDLWNLVALMLTLGIVGTVLATIGIYGAVSFAVSQRMRDLGIRVALGATRFRIVSEVLISGGKPVLHGLLAGLWLSVLTATGLRESVKGSPLRLDSGEPLLYAAAALLLAAAATAAMLGPARRGANSDPLEALRCE